MLYFWIKAVLKKNVTMVGNSNKFYLLGGKGKEKNSRVQIYSNCIKMPLKRSKEHQPRKTTEYLIH